MDISRDNDIILWCNQVQRELSGVRTGKPEVEQLKWEATGAKFNGPNKLSEGEGTDSTVFTDIDTINSRTLSNDSGSRGSRKCREDSKGTRTLSSSQEFGKALNKKCSSRVTTSHFLTKNQSDIETTAKIVSLEQDPSGRPAIEDRIPRLQRSYDQSSSPTVQFSSSQIDANEVRLRNDFEAQGKHTLKVWKIDK